jgi:membrane protein YdbS with pleckstrin-like domain
MTCGNCGAPLAPGSRFCNVCGATVAASAVAVGQRNALDQRGEELPEQVVWTLRPAFLFVGVRYAVAAGLWLVAAAVVAAIVSWLELSVAAGALVVAALGLLLFVKPIVAHVRRQRQLFTLTTHKLEIREGLLATTVRNVPLSKCQDVTVSSSVTQRLLGLGSIAIDNASEGAGRLVIADVSGAKRYADRLLAELRRWN